MKKHILLFLIIIYSLLTINYSKAQWQHTKEPGDTVSCIATDGINIFAGTWNKGIFLSADNGATWKAVNNGIPLTSSYFYISCLLINNGNIFAGTSTDGLYISSDNGNSWKAVNNGLTMNYIKSLAIKDTNMFAGTMDGGIFLSSDYGKNWASINKGLIYNSEFHYFSIYSLAVKGDKIFAGTPIGLYSSINNGTSWDLLSNRFHHNNYYGVSELAINGDYIFAGVYSVFVSTDNGISWIEMNNGLPDSENIVSLIVKGTNVFAATWNKGIFLSTDTCKNWTNIIDGLSNKNICSLGINETYLFAGTWGNGLYKRSLSDILGINEQSTINDQPSTNIYPNPATDNITIAITGNNTTNTKITIINITGKELFKTTTNQQKKTISTTAFPAGIYFARITTPISSSTHKFIITK